MALADLLPLPLLVVLAVVAVGVLLLIVLRPARGLVLLVAVLVSSVSAVVGSVGPVSPFLIAVAVALGALGLGRRRGTVRLVWSPVLTLALVYLASRALSLVGARDVPAGLQSVLGDGRDLLLLLVLTPLLAALPDPRRAAAVAVGVVSLLAALTVVQEFVLDNATTFGGFSNIPLGQDVGAATVRHSGPQADVNFWGRTLALLLPLALVLAHRRHGRPSLGWIGAALVLCAGEYLSQSRGGLLALVAAGMIWLLLSGLSARRLSLLALAGFIVALLIPGVASRLTTLTMVNPGPPSQSDRSLVDRAAVQQVGLAIFADSPLTGVGAGNFEASQPEYRRRYAPGLSQVLAPHNLYLQMLAESGLVGLLGWLSFYGGALFVALRAFLISRRLALSRSLGIEGRLAAGVVAGLVGWALASLFLHLGDLGILVVLVALGAALDIRARARAAATELPDRIESVTRRPGLRRGARRPLLVGGAALLALAVASLAVTRTAGGTRWAASTRATVTPTAAAADSSYVRDVLSRETVVLTYAALARDPSFLRAAATAVGLPEDVTARASVTVVHAPTTEVFDVVVSTPRSADALRLAPAVLRSMQQYVDALDTLYVVRPELDSATSVQPVQRGRQVPLGLAVAGMLSLVAGLARRPARAAHGQPPATDQTGA